MPTVLPMSCSIGITSTPEALHQMRSNLGQLGTCHPLVVNSPAKASLVLAVWLQVVAGPNGLWVVTSRRFSGIDVAAKQQAACAAEQISVSRVLVAGQGRAGQRRAGQGRAGQGRAGQSKAGLQTLYKKKAIQFASMQSMELQMQQPMVC